MTQDQLLQLVQMRGYEARVKKAEVVVRDCWYCGNPKWNLELNLSKGVYRCWACKESGRLEQLIGDSFGVNVRIPVNLERRERETNYSTPTALPTVPASEVMTARNYLASRSLDEFDLLRYEVKVCNEVGHHMYGRIIFPVREFWSQLPVGYVGRAYIGGQRPKYLAQVEPPCIVGYKQRSQKAPYVIVEGVLDAVAVHKAGFNSAALLGLGFDDHLERFAARIPPDARLVIFLDGEAQERAQQLVWRARAIRSDIVNAALPNGRDPAEIMPDVLKVFVNRAINTDRHSVGTMIA